MASDEQMRKKERDLHEAMHHHKHSNVTSTHAGDVKDAHRMRAESVGLPPHLAMHPGAEAPPMASGSVSNSPPAAQEM